jgi:hypothetical protein
MVELDYGSRKLAHYNKWLLDPKRVFGSKYAGFPEDLNDLKGIKMESNVIASVTEQLTKTAKAPAVKAPAKGIKVARMGRGSSPTKGELALQIYQRLSGDKVSVINELQNSLGMSTAGATTYFYNAKKAAAAA